jgi:hypothetical protein
MVFTVIKDLVIELKEEQGIDDGAMYDLLKGIDDGALDTLLQ